MNKEEFGEYLKKVRDSRGLTIRQVATYTGVSYSYLSLIENGKREIPSPDILKKLAPLYKVPYEILMREAGYIKAETVVIEKEDLPEELKDIGVELASVIQDAKQRGMSEEDIKEIIEFGVRLRHKDRN